MKSTGFFLLFLGSLLATSPTLIAQSPPATNDIEQLKSLVGAQQKALEQQQVQIQKLQSALAEQQQMLIGVVQNGSGAKLLPTVDRTVDLRAADYNLQAPQRIKPHRLSRSRLWSSRRRCKTSCSAAQKSPTPLPTPQP